MADNQQKNRSRQAAHAPRPTSKSINDHESVGREKQEGWNWAIGVTTAPRRIPTLQRCLESLKTAGWEAPYVFVEPGVQFPQEFAHLPQSRRAATLGAFPNWYVAMTELVMMMPHADAFALVQDDTILSKGLRGYLERTLWPAPEVGVVSAYCPRHYARRGQIGYFVEDNGWDTGGALFYIFPNSAARRIVTDPLYVTHRFSGVSNGMRNIDSVVGLWCRERGLSYFVHSPSLVQHIGNTSTIWKAANNGKRRARRLIADASSLQPTVLEYCGHSQNRKDEAFTSTESL